MVVFASIGFRPRVPRPTLGMLNAVEATLVKELPVFVI
mgnify:CR=1 FL=1